MLYICVTTNIHVIMTLTEEIKNNPYLKISNCLDSCDLEEGMSAVLELESNYGRSKMLDKIFEKLFDKKEKFFKKK